MKLYEYLLSLFNLQFHANAKAAKSILKCLQESFLHQNLMKCTNHTSTNKHHSIWQQLERGGEKLTFNISTLRCYILFSFFTYSFAEAENLLSFQPIRNQIFFYLIGDVVIGEFGG